MELLKNYLEQIRKEYNVPNNYKSYDINHEIWEKVKLKKIEHTNIIMYEEMFVNEEFGYYKNKDFIVVNTRDLQHKERELTYLFTDNVKKVFETYFKDIQTPQRKFIAKKGVWKPISTMSGWTFHRTKVGIDGEPILNDNLNDKLNNEINSFLKNEKMYKDIKIEYKRGILLFGPPGNGKTSFIKHFVKNMNAMTILASSLNLNEAEFLQEFLGDKDNDFILKIVVYEDIDGMPPDMRSEFLNFLDGLSRMHKVIFIATTNYPDKVDPALKKRPSRFDTIIKIDYPNKKVRRKLLKRFFPKLSGSDLEYAVNLSEGFSGAYFKEIFILSKLNDTFVTDTIKEIRKRFSLLE